MPCKICGDPITRWRPENRQTLCNSCAADTPRKIGRSEFDRKYWGPDFEEVHPETRREFYEDYLTSSQNFRDYQESTTRNEFDRLTAEAGTANPFN